MSDSRTQNTPTFRAFAYLTSIERNFRFWYLRGETNEKAARCFLFYNFKQINREWNGALNNNHNQIDPSLQQAGKRICVSGRGSDELGQDAKKNAPGGELGDSPLSCSQNR